MKTTPPPTEIFADLPANLRIAHLPPKNGLTRALFLEADTASPPEAVSLGGIPGMTACLALQRINPWSFEPVTTTDLSRLPAEMPFLLWQQEDGQFGVLIPLADGNARHYLGGDPDGLVLRRMPWDQPTATCRLLFAAMGPDPFMLVEASVGLLSKQLRTFRPRWEKPLPRWIDLLGWCTWDAFYREVSEDGVMEGLEAARKTQVPFGFMILDDGWQDTDDRQLISFGAHPGKLPHGLASLIERAKGDYGIRLFGVWHAFQGYWYGIRPDSPAARDYRLIHTSRKAHNRPEDEAAERDLLHPDDVHRFYHDYHRVLREAGVDFIKVDNQGSLDHFLSPDTVAPTPTMARYQEAMQGAAQYFFQGETLHCLSQGTDVLFNLEAANVMRNSEDYYPGRPDTQGKHVYTNALNNLFMQAFCVPDWDMFHSGAPLGGFHAAARALSGGPVYVSDKPGEWDSALIRKLVYSDGTALRCPQPALPTADSLFRDAYRHRHLLKIQNRNAHAALLGLFNCFQGEGSPATLSGTFSASDIRGIEGEAFALYFHQTQTAKASGRTETHAVNVASLDWEIVTVAPLVNGLAVFGLIDKLNGSAAILTREWNAPNELEIELREGGAFGFHSLHEPMSVTVDNAPVPVRREGEALWIAEVPVRAHVRVRICVRAAG